MNRGASRSPQTPAFPPPLGLPVGAQLGPAVKPPFFSSGGVAGQRVPFAYGLIGVIVVIVSVGISLQTARVFPAQWGSATLNWVALTVAYLPPMLWVLWGRRRRRHDIGLRWSWHDLWLGPVLLVAAKVVQGVLVLTLTALGLPMVSNATGLADDLTPSGWAFVFVAAVIVAPIVEEVLFRGVLLRSLLAIMGPWAAIVVQGVVFGCMHVQIALGAGNWGLSIVLSAMGVVLGALTYYRRGIWASVIAHALSNGLALIVLSSGWLPPSAL